MTTQWILAFDASCSRCVAVAKSVHSVGDDDLAIKPLQDHQVQRYRETLGLTATWAPVLLKIGPAPQAWTGRRMTLPLVRLLGVRRTWKLLAVLGDSAPLQSQQPVSTEAATNATNLSRKSFLRFGAGALVAGGLVLTGQLPAFASTDPVEAWVKKNAGNLPRDYDGVTGYTLEYRRAIFQQLPNGNKTELWLEQFRRFRSNHKLSEDQQAHLAIAETIVADPATYTSGADLSRLGGVDGFRERSEQLFGREDSIALFATLGPPMQVAADQRGCTCSTSSDWCNNSTHCFRTNCINNSGCGSFWSYTCDGLCRN